MKKPTKAFVAVAATSIALIMAGLMTIPFNGTAQAAADHDLVAPEAELRGSMTEEAARGDLLVPAECLGQVWPDISAECLLNDDGSPANEVRSVTIGYQTGDDTTVLIRMPAPEAQVASN